MNKKTTKQLLRVFFIIALISVVGIFLQWNKKNTQTVKIKGGSFSEGIIGTPRFINPVLAQSQSDKDMTELLFSSLINQNQLGENSFNLAESLEISKDKKNYTLKLKSNIFFHDGNKITTDDVIFTIEKIQDPLIKSPLFNKWEGVRIEKISNLEIKFTLDQEYSDFQNNFKIGVLPKHLWKEVKSEEFIFNDLNNKPIGSGNYALKKIEYKKTGIPKYYILKRANKSNAYIEEIKIFFYENEIDLANAYRNREINAAYGLSANKENRDLFDNEFSSTGKLPRIFGLFFNQNKQKILKDKNIRLLINEAIDREKIINKIFLAYAYPIDNIIGGMQMENKKSGVIKYEKLLEKKGWNKNENGIFFNKKENKELNLEISTPNVKELIDVANIIKEDLFKYGININIRIFEESDFHQKVIRPRDYEILLFGYMIEKQTDLYAFWHSSQKNDPGFNISLYSNSKVDKELEKLRKNKKSANINLIIEEIKKDIPAVFIYSPAYTYLLPKKIKGENIVIIEKNDRFSNIKDWYINTRKVWNIFLEK